MLEVHSITLYHGEPVDELIASVESAIAAGVDKAIIVGDGYAVPRTCPGRHFIKPESGIPASWNEAFDRAVSLSASWVAIVATGDRMAPDRLEHGRPTQMAQMGDWVDELGSARRPSKDWEQRIYRDNQFSLGTALIPIGIWRAVGGMDPTLPFCSDWDFAMRVQHQFGWQYVPKICAVAGEWRGGHTRTAHPWIRQMCAREVRFRGQALRGKFSKAQGVGRYVHSPDR